MKHPVTAAPDALAVGRPTSSPNIKPHRVRFLRLTVTPDLEVAFVGVIIVTVLLTSALWALVVPFNAAPDESEHFAIDRYIAIHNQLPIFDQSPGIRHTVCYPILWSCLVSYASQPPGAPLLGAAMMKIYHAVSGQPYNTLTGPARFASALCIAVYVLFLYLICRVLLRDRYMRLTALMIGAFIPQVIFLGAYVNDDSFGLASGTAVLYVSIVALRDGLHRRTALLMGVSLGALALAKPNYFAVFVLFVICVIVRLYTEWRTGTARHFLRFLALAAVIGAIISAWSFVRAQLLYGDPTGMAIARRHIAAIAPWYEAHTIAGQGGTILTVLNNYPWVQLTFESFWGRFGNQAIQAYPTLRMDDHVYGWLRLCAELSLLGAIVALVRYLVAHRGIAAADRWRTQVWVMGVGLIILTIFLSLWMSLTYAFQAQGRYLFPALVPLVLLLTVGIQGWTNARAYRAVAFAIVALAILCLNVYALTFLNVPTFLNW